MCCIQCLCSTPYIISCTTCIKPYKEQASLNMGRNMKSGYSIDFMSFDVETQKHDFLSFFPETNVHLAQKNVPNNFNNKHQTQKMYLTPFIYLITIPFDRLVPSCVWVIKELFRPQPDHNQTQNTVPFVDRNQWSCINGLIGFLY